MALTATDFADSCAAFANKYTGSPQTQWKQEIHRSGYLGWTWNPHSVWPAFGYLSRMVLVTFVSHSVNATTTVILEQEDDLEEVTTTNISVPPSGSDGVLTAMQYIVYSPSFQVPAFYFIVSDASGTPLTLEETIKTSLFRPCVLSHTSIHETHIDLPQGQESLDVAKFPLLSQGDHPVLQISCFYLHPCETQRAVEELLSAQRTEWEGAPQIGKEAWIETWLLVVGNLLNLEN